MFSFLYRPICVIAVAIWLICIPCQAEENFKIGAILPLSGSISTHGEFIKRGIDLALVDTQGVTVIYEDNNSKANATATAYKKLLHSDRVNAIITLGSPMAMTLAPMVNRDKILLFSVAATPAYSSPNDYTFQSVGSAQAEAYEVIKVLTEVLKTKRVALLYMDNDYGQGTAKEFKKALKDKVSLVFEDSFQADSPDMRAQLTKLRSTKPDSVFIAAWGRETGLVTRQARELGIKANLLCSQASQNPDLLEIAGKAAEGMLVVAPTDAATSSFRDIYSKSFKGAPPFPVLRAYDTTRVLTKISEICKSSNYAPECLLREANALDGFPGVAYPITFDQNGDLQDRFVRKKVQGGEFVLFGKPNS